MAQVIEYLDRWGKPAYALHLDEYEMANLRWLMRHTTQGALSMVANTGDWNYQIANALDRLNMSGADGCGDPYEPNGSVLDNLEAKDVYNALRKGEDK